MKAKGEAEIGQALDAPEGKFRLFLLHGPDESGSRMLADRLAIAMGADAERVDLDGSTLKSDPARLTDEATAITMFGGARWIRASGGDEVLPAVEALLEAPRGCPVVLIAGQLKPASALAKLATASPDILAHASWKPEGGRADAIALQLARPMGLKLESDAARLLADATTGDRALMARELEKLALYVDAAPDRPRAITAHDVEAVGAALDQRETWTLVDALFDGRADLLAGELAGEAAADAIPALRAVARRAVALGRARARLPSKTFNRIEKEAVDRTARNWPPDLVAKMHTAAMDAEGAVKTPGNAGDVLAAHTLIGLGRAAARRR